MNVTPLTLTGSIVRLEPLSLTHAADLAAAGADPNVWRLMPYGQVTSPELMQAFVAETISKAEKDGDIPFAVVLNGTNRAIGSTRYLDVRPSHRALEIGGTWYGSDHQRTGVNTECKRLLLTHAFESLGAIRVQLKTDLRNERSQRAIERIGGKREGVLRENMILPDGYRRSTVYYSILEAEWPEVKARLAELANRAR